MGGKEKNKHEHKKLKSGRGTTGKQAVLGIRQRDGRVVAGPVSTMEKENIHGIIERIVEAGSVIHTDEHKSYTGIRDRIHKTVNHSNEEWVRGDVHVNGVESVWSLLKRGINGTFHHVSRKHLRRYVDEFSFRLNQGSCKRHTMDRIKSMLNGAEGKRITWASLTR